MIPQTEAVGNLEFETYPSETYKLNFEDQTIQGKVHGLEAMRQAIYKILNTPRFTSPIYSWNYGMELDDLIGKPKGYAYPMIKQRIQEALLQDDRIESVDHFTFIVENNTIVVTFTVITILGEVEAEKEVRA